MIKKQLLTFLGVFVGLVLAGSVSAQTYYNPYTQPTYYSGYSQNSYTNDDFTYVYTALQIDLQRAQQTGDIAQLRTILLILIELLQAQLTGQLGEIGDNNTNNNSNLESDIEVETGSARSVGDDRATLEGEVDLNGADEAWVFFEYGEDEDDLDETTDREELDDRDDEDIEVRVTRLDEDERYYYRLVAIDQDTKEYIYGDIEDFRTDDDDDRRDDDEPDVRTEEADDIRDDEAELNGSVDMNDFRDGVVFFVWGEDKDMVEDVEGEDEYRDVDEDGDDLQKQRVDTDLDNDEDYSLDIDSLDDDTRIYYTICVEYEDDDRDEQIICGDVEDFRTDD